MFTWYGQYYCYMCAPNGLSNCPYIFTKISKPLLGHLHKQLVNILIYIDDTLLVAESIKKLHRNIQLTLYCFKNAGFLVNFKKSLLKPTQQIVFLGFLIDSVEYIQSIRQLQESMKYELQLCVFNIQNPWRELVACSGDIF